MIGVLLVDDEFYIRERMKIIVNWEALGFTILGEAGNGAQALALIEELAPRLLLVDIKMPEMDGLALAKEVHRQYPQMFIVILSGYDIFGYAQQAIRYGVTGYLLKPVNRAELLELLETLKIKLTHQERSQRGFALAEATLTDDCLHHLIFESEPLPAEFTGEYERLAAAISGRQAVLALFRLPDTYVSRGFGLQLHSLLSGHSPPESVFAFHVTDTVAGFCLCVDSHKPAGDLLCGLYRDLCAALQLTSRLAVSRAFHTAQGICEAYREAEFALRESIFFEDQIVWYENARAAYCEEAMPVGSLRGELLLALRVRQPGQARDLVSRQFSLLTERYRSFANLSLLAYEIYSTVTIYGEDASWSVSGELHVQKVLESFSDFTELAEWFISFLDLPYHWDEKGRGSAQYRTVRQTRGVIDRSFSNPDCNLDYIAQELGLNANYISGLFKKIIGIPIVQYITNCRMEAAKELLKDEYRTLADICEKVGYNDVFYFSKRFKQYYGISPSRFSANGKTRPL